MRRRDRWPAAERLRTWMTVRRRGLPDPCSRPMSWHQMLIRTTSAMASDRRAVFFSNAVSSSPRSRPSLPCNNFNNAHVLATVSKGPCRVTRMNEALVAGTERSPRNR